MAGEETLGLPGVRQRQRIQFLGPERDSEGRFTYGKIESVSRVEQCEWHCGQRWKMVSMDSSGESNVCALSPTLIIYCCIESK